SSGDTAGRRPIEDRPAGAGRSGGRAVAEPPLNREPIDDAPAHRERSRMGDPAAAAPPISRADDHANPRLTLRRLVGLDRSGPPPPETLAGQPLRPWTIPNAIGLVRLLLIPVFLVVAVSSSDGTGAGPAGLFAIVAWGDYADGIAARVTRQYSRLGTLMDPITDRLLVIAGVIVCWHFELLPRWALAVLIAR